MIDASAERLLWEQVIRVDYGAGRAERLFDIAALADAASKARELATVWNVDVNLGDVSLSEEGRSFIRWQSSWQRMIDERQWTTAFDQQMEVLRLLEQGSHIALPDTVTLAGFDQYTPFAERLFTALAQRGVRVDIEPRVESAFEAAAGVFADALEECRAVARWVKARLDQVPTERIGIITPNVAGIHDLLARELDAALHPELGLPRFAEEARVYNFSLGHPLAQVPLVATALGLLELAVRPNQAKQMQLSRLLRSPYWSTTAEADERAVLDRMLRQTNRSYVDLHTVLAQIQSLAAKRKVKCVRFIRHFSYYVAQLDAVRDARQAPSAWSARIAEWLHVAGWVAGGETELGDRTLSSNEYQARVAWNTVLEQYARYDDILGTVTFTETVNRLKALCAQRVFQPRTRGMPQVHVLGMLESAGFAFDAIWVMGMTEQAWPPPAAPNPLLSVTVQRDKRIPNACAAVQLEYAEKIIDRLCRQAPVVRFSWPATHQGRNRRPSPLVADLPRLAADPSYGPDPGRPVRLEEVMDASAPAISGAEVARGGTWALRAQAICPAWAFYQYRLGATRVKRPENGLDAAERGTLVHDALEYFWKQVENADALKLMEDGIRTDLIAQAAESSLGRHEQKGAALPPVFRALERSRLIGLLDEWLTFEATRRHAFSVVAVEMKGRYTIEGMQLEMRIDRIDRQSEGLVIIDYKTGSTMVSPRVWTEDRITEPQLPAYALYCMKAFSNQPIAAIALAKVREEKVGFVGVAAHKNVLPNVNGPGPDADTRSVFGRFADWQALLDHWQRRLGAIAREYKDGQASVTFVDRTQLINCDVFPLLRLAEREALLARDMPGHPATT